MLPLISFYSDSWRISDIFVLKSIKYKLWRNNDKLLLDLPERTYQTIECWTVSHIEPQNILSLLFFFFFKLKFKCIIMKIDSKLLLAVYCQAIQKLTLYKCIIYLQFSHTRMLLNIFLFFHSWTNYFTKTITEVITWEIWPIRAW